MHREEDAAVDGFQAVADVWEGAADDDGHGILFFVLFFSTRSSLRMRGKVKAERK